MTHMTDADRIAALRFRCLERKHRAWRNTLIPYAASLAACSDEASWQIRRGRATRDILASVRFEIDDLELLVGRLGPRPAEETDEALDRAGEWAVQYPQSPGGQTGHCELDLRPIFELGADALSESIRGRIPSGTEEEQEAWRSFIFALEGLSLMIERAAQAARDAAGAAEAARRAELEQMAATCDRIAYGPPRTFREAIQLLWFVIFAVQYAESVALVVPGRLDRSLRPFYEADLSSGRMTRDEALLLIESLYLLINEFVPDGLAVSVMVGGRDARGDDASGSDTTNDLSCLCLEALRRTKLVYPTVGVCWHEGTPQELTRLAVELIAAGYSTPAFFGDETIRRGLAGLGLPPEQACNYINSTCVEITPVGCSNVWVASPYFNLCGMLLETIDECARAEATSRDATVAAPATFAEFRGLYEDLLANRIPAAADEQNELRRIRAARGGKPLQSVFTNDCIDRGRDIDAGGARVNWVECSFVGLANLADSLLVIEEEIYGSGRLDFTRLKALLDGDYAGAEAERLRLLNKYPKYGSGDSRVDRFVGETVEFVRERCASARMEPDGSSFVPGAFVWIMHERLGRETRATPDGRHAGEPFADGAGPAQGRELRGPTAAILSTTSWDHSPFVGGVAFNMKFNSSVAEAPGGVDRLQELILEYLRRGGFETQVNVVNRAVLEAAREHPEQYADLVVRIGGYTDYFTRLSPGMQDEVLRRTEYASA